MAEHNILGSRGEEAAARFLVLHGYNIVERDWRMGHCDIDIIARKNGELIFVEVKTRSSEDYGLPEEAVTAEKMRHIVQSANAYVRLEGTDMPVRFDIISVVGDGHNFRIRHLRRAFHENDWHPSKHPHTSAPILNP